LTSQAINATTQFNCAHRGIGLAAEKRNSAFAQNRLLSAASDLLIAAQCPRLALTFVATFERESTRCSVVRGILLRQ
jgi:hypothetical protein